MSRMAAKVTELLPDARRLAVSLLAGGSPARRGAGGEGVQELRKSTAAAVKRSLLALDIADLHAGYEPGRGYVHECDAAAELVEQAIEPFGEDARRRLRLGLTEAAQAVALGVLDGLEACEGSYDGDDVLSYAGEDLAEDYGHQMRNLLRETGAVL